MFYLDYFFFFQAEDGIRDLTVTGVQTCALPISRSCSRRCAATASRARTTWSTGAATRAMRPATTSCTSSRRSEEHTSELQSQSNLVCRLLLEKKKETWRFDAHVTDPTIVSNPYF